MAMEGMTQWPWMGTTQWPWMGQPDGHVGDIPMAMDWDINMAMLGTSQWPRRGTSRSL